MVTPHLDSGNAPTMPIRLPVGDRVTRRPGRVLAIAATALVLVIGAGAAIAAWVGGAGASSSIPLVPTGVLGVASPADPCSLPGSTLSTLPDLASTTPGPLGYDMSQFPGMTGCRYTHGRQAQLTVELWPAEPRPESDPMKYAYQDINSRLEAQERQYVSVEDLPKSGARATFRSGTGMNAVQLACRHDGGFVTVDYVSTDPSLTPAIVMGPVDDLAVGEGCRA